MAWTAYWADEKGEKMIRGIVTELKNRYRLPFSETDIHTFAGMVFGELCLPDEQVIRSRTFADAERLIDFFDIKPDAKGEVIIKHSKGSFKMDEKFLQLLKDSILDDYVDAMNDTALWGEPDERKEQIRQLAREEHRDKVHALRQSLNRLIDWLRGVGIFTNQPKTVSNSEGAFLYDLLFEIERVLKREIFQKTNKPKTPPHKLDNASKRKIIASYLPR